MARFGSSLLKHKLAQVCYSSAETQPTPTSLGFPPKEQKESDVIVPFCRALLHLDVRSFFHNLFPQAPTRSSKHLIDSPLHQTYTYGAGILNLVRVDPTLHMRFCKCICIMHDDHCSSITDSPTYSILHRIERARMEEVLQLD